VIVDAVALEPVAKRRRILKLSAGHGFIVIGRPAGRAARRRPQLCQVAAPSARTGTVDPR
jgi:hypothetical protein